MRINRGIGLRGGLLAAALSVSPAAAEANLSVGGFAWTQYVNGITPMYKGAANFDRQPFVSGGGMIFLGNKPSDLWTASLSMGVAFGNSAIKKTLMDTSGTIVLSKTNPHSISMGMGAFLYEANIAYQNGPLALKLGKFHYAYSDYNHNMGLYLLRGPVYPGYLYSGFGDIGGITKTGLLGSWSPMKSLRWDVLGNFEMDFKPFMDINLSSFITFQAGMLEIGAGIEMQRLVEFNPCVTSPGGRGDVDNCLGGDANALYVDGQVYAADPDGYKDSVDFYRSSFLITDTTGVGNGGVGDTTTFSLAGTKVMVRGALDVKKILGGYKGSSQDFVLYFEAALLGIKDYKYIYEKKGERLPILVGFNVPTFGALDLLSLEVEYYNAQYQNDPHKLVGAYDVFSFSDGNSINFAMSPIPSSNTAGNSHIIKAEEDFDPSKDNLKWSLHVAKKIHEKITFKVQLASDHWRVPNNNFVNYEAAANPGQFYGALKVDYSL